MTQHTDRALLDPASLRGAQPLPPGVRPDLRRITAFLALKPKFEELLRAADGLDLRDLTERELAYLEGVGVKTVQKWREQGRGPEYRDEAGIRYPLHLYLAWRERGVLRSTKEGRRARG